MEINQELKELGLTDNEITVYLSLLRIGGSMAGRIASESNLERTSVYNALKRLVQEGIVSYVIESNRKVFYASNPQKLVEMFDEKKERASMIVKKLEAIRKFEKQKENIMKFRGYNGIKTVMNDVLRSCKDNAEYLIFGSENQLGKRMPVFAQIYVAKKDKKKLRSRILIREDLKSAGKKMSKYTKVRYVPKQMASLVNVNVYSDKVSILLWSEIPEAVIIDNKEAADTFRNYFEFMWHNAKD